MHALSTTLYMTGLCDW